MILTFLPGGTLAEWPPLASESCELSASLFSDKLSSDSDCSS